ncbi:MAG: ZIP family metal transporter [Clostridia bacterium]|nr:ZIP family metal transporter [Clostridia bacterium]
MLLESLLVVTIIGLVTGMVGTGLGGMTALCLISPSKRLVSTLLGFAGGLMLSVVCFDLLPEAFKIAHTGYSILGIILGVSIIVFLDEVMYRIRRKKGIYKGKDYIKMGMLMGIGIAIHNFPEGLAIGSGFSAADKLGFSLSLVIALHNIPEGLAMATPMRIGGMSRAKILFSTIVAGIPMGIGAFIGVLLGGISNIFISICLGFAAGAMLYITCSELIPESQSLYSGRASGFGIIIGVVIGMIISVVI